MKQPQKKLIITAALLALLTTSVGCAVYDDHDRYGSRRYDRYGRLDLDRDGRVERWERDRSPSYYGRERYDRYSDSRYRDRFDR